VLRQDISCASSAALLFQKNALRGVALTPCECVVSLVSQMAVCLFTFVFFDRIDRMNRMHAGELLSAELRRV